MWIQGDLSHELLGGDKHCGSTNYSLIPNYWPTIYLYKLFKICAVCLDRLQLSTRQIMPGLLSYPNII